MRVHPERLASCLLRRLLGSDAEQGDEGEIALGHVVGGDDGVGDGRGRDLADRFDDRVAADRHRGRPGLSRRIGE